MDQFLISTRRYVTLLELIIAMMLTSLVLVALNYFYLDIVHIGTMTDKVRNEGFYMHYIENRLLNTVSKAIPKKDQARDSAFFSTNDAGLAKPGSQTLVFMFDNGVSLDKEFSNHVLGRLYLDPQGNLTLTYWPSPKRKERPDSPWPMKKEILLQGASSLAFEFFIAPEKSSQTKSNESSDQNQTQKQQEGQSPEPKGDWTAQLWLKEYNQLPVLVKIIVSLEKPNAPRKDSIEKMLFVLPLVNAEGHIVYD